MTQRFARTTTGRIVNIRRTDLIDLVGADFVDDVVGEIALEYAKTVRSTCVDALEVLRKAEDGGAELPALVDEVESVRRATSDLMATAQREIDALTGFSWSPSEPFDLNLNDSIR